MTNYTDLEIHLFPRETAGYPVTLRLGAEQEFPPGYLAADDLLPWVSTGTPVADGKRLFDKLLADPALHHAWDLAAGQAPGRRVRLWLDPAAPELHTLPWELLHDGQTFIAADTRTPFSRYLASEIPWGGPCAELPLRLLLVVANPTNLPYNLSPLDPITEYETLNGALDKLLPKHLQLEVLKSPVTLTRLEAELRQGYSVLHLVAHGMYHNRNGAILYLEDETGHVQMVSSESLAEMLRRLETLPQLIFLAACESGARSPAVAFQGLGPQLVAAGVPAVVAMQERVSMQSAQTVSQIFYTELAAHGMVDRALNAARAALFTNNRPDAATPVLFMRLQEGQIWEPVWVMTNPYRGLAAFTEAEAKYFYGRTRLVDTLVTQLRSDPRLLVVVGDSGSGKSSVVQAGLIPALRQGRLPGSQEWHIVSCRPGPDPYAELVQAGIDLPGLLSSVPVETPRLVLFVDQFEELFALCTPEVQCRFLDDLLTLAMGPRPVTLILAVRADFYHHLLRTPLEGHLHATQVNVIPLQLEDLRKTIAMPAEQVGLRFEAGLVDTIADEARIVEHPLPLLQATLTQLWYQQRRGVLSYSGYKAVGRVAGALGGWADNAYYTLNETEQTLARQIITRLVHFGEDENTDMRQRVLLVDLTVPEAAEEAHRLVKRLADARLLVTGGSAAAPTVELVHDALLQEWGQLRSWRAEHREFCLWRQRLDAKIVEWKTKDQNPDALLRGELLTEAERWLAERPTELNAEEQAYLRAGIAQREAEAAARARSIRRLRIALVVALLFLSVALAASRIAVRQIGVARDAKATASAEAQIRATAQAQIREQKQIALAGHLAAQAGIEQSDLAGSLQLAGLLAIESMSRHPNLEASTTLLEVLERLPSLKIKIAYNNNVNNVIFSPDGHLVAADNGAKILIWDVVSGNQIAEMQSEGAITALAFSQDNCFIASGYETGVVLIREINTAKIQQKFSYSERIENILYDPKGHWLFIREGIKIHVWDVAEQREVEASFQKFSEDNGTLEFNFNNHGRWWVNNGKTYIIGKNLIWDSIDNYPETVIIKNNYGWYVTVSADGRWLAEWSYCHHCYDQNRTSVYDTTTGQEVLRLMGKDATALFDFSADSKEFITNRGQVSGTWLSGIKVPGLVQIWGTDTWEEIFRIEDQEEIIQVALDANGSSLALAKDKSMKIFVISHDFPVHSNETSGYVLHQSWSYDFGKGRLHFIPTGELLVTTGEGLTIWNSETAQKIANIAPISITLVSGFEISPNGRWIAAGNSDKTVRVWGIEEGQEIISKTYYNEVGKVAFSPNSQLIASAEWCEFALRECQSNLWVWDLLNGKDLFVKEYPGRARFVIFSPDGEKIALVSDDGTSSVWEINKSKLLFKTGSEETPVNVVTFSSDSQKLMTGSGKISAGSYHARGLTQIWELSNGKEISRNEHVDGGVWFTSFISNGQAISVDQQFATIWGIDGGRDINRISLLSEGGWGIRSIALTADKKWLVTVEGIGPDYFTYGVPNIIAAVRELPSGREITRLTFADKQRRFLALSLSPNDQNFAIMEDRGWSIWPLRPESWQKLACSRLTRNLTHKEWQQYLGDEPYRATCPNLPEGP